jgi:hypothetical protein
LKKSALPKVGISSMAQINPKDDRKDREGKRLTSFFMPDAAKVQLQEMAIHERTTIQVLLSEAANMLFKDRGKPPIA